MRPVFLLLVLWELSLAALDCNLIVELKSGSEALRRDNENYVKALNGIYPGAIAHRTVAGLETQLKQYRTLQPDDTLSIFIFGHASVSPRRISMPMTDGRITGRKFAEYLDAIPAKQNLFLFHTRSSALADALAANGRFILAAHDSNEQLNPPVLPRFLLGELKKEKTVSMALIERAGRETEDYFRRSGLARAENMKIRADGKTLHYPFDGSTSKVAVFGTGGGRAEKFDWKIPELKWNPSTPETVKTVKSGRDLSEQYRAYPMFLLFRSVSFVLNPEKSAIRTVVDLYYMNRDGVSPLRHGNLSLSGGSVKLIRADGSWLESSGGILPAPRKGDVVTLTRSTPIPVPSHLPELQVEFPVQTTLPVAGFSLSFNSIFPHKLQNPPKTLEKVEQNGAVSYAGGPLSACPDRAAAFGVTISSLKSWTEFLDWTHRMTDRSMTLDSNAQLLLKQLVAGKKTTLEKVRAIYDYWNGIRYVTLPLGAAAFRPQTPGTILKTGYADCKDKASALVAFCREAGIPAERVLVNRGGDIDPDFPSWQFNHMLVYLPVLEGFPDGLWLDATDGVAPFGDLPPGDAGTTGLILSEKPEFKKVTLSALAGKNVWNRRIVFRNGAADVTGKNLGIFQYRENMLKKAGPAPEFLEEFAGRLQNEILPGAEIRSFELEKNELRLSAPEQVPEFPAILSEQVRAPKIHSPRTLFDSRDWTVVQTVEYEHLRFAPLEWKKSAGTVSFHIAANGKKIELTVSGKGGKKLSPADYLLFRRVLKEAVTKWRTLR